MTWPALPLALGPRLPGPRCDRAAAERLLESERTVVAALAVRAIADGWDTGRIGAADGELPREREVIGLLGISQGLAPERVAEAAESLSAVLRQAQMIEDETPGLHPLTELVQEFALGAMARMMLMLIAAPQLWGEIASLYAIAANSDRRSAVDEHLLRQVLGPRANPHDIAAELAPDRPLRRFGLVRMITPAAPPFAGLAPDPLVLARLRAEPLQDDPTGQLQVIGASKPLAELRLPAAVAGPLCELIAREPARPLRLVVRGREGSGRRTLLAGLAGLAGRRLAVVHLHHLADDHRVSPGELRRALERCAIAGWIPCLDGLDAVPADDRGLRDRLRRVIAEFLGPVMVRAERDAQPPIEPGYHVVDLPDLSETERLTVWREQLAAHGITAGAVAGNGDPARDLAPLAARWRIGPGTIHRVVRQVREGASGAVTSADVDRAVSQHLESRLGDVAERVRHLPRIDDMVLPADIIDSLIEFLARMRLHRRVFEDWGMTRVATTGRGITALFQGPPGTGKTMVAGALARELGIELYRVDLSRVMSKWIGETERNLASVFAAAEEGQAILLFDEADSLFSKRTEVRSSNDRFANLEVNYLLQRLDSFTGIAILTTNLGTAIDAAFKRRLSFRIHFTVPDEDQREQLWRSHLPPSLPTADDIDLGDLARRYPLTGGSVRNCVLRAAFLAAAEYTVLSQEHLLRAVRLEYRAAGKLSESGPLE